MTASGIGDLPLVAVAVYLYRTRPKVFDNRNRITKSGRRDAARIVLEFRRPVRIQVPERTVKLRRFQWRRWRDEPAARLD